MLHIIREALAFLLGKPQKARSRSGNRIEELVNKLLQKNRAEKLEGELGKFDLSTLSPAELESWWYYHGIVAFRAGKERESLERFQEAYRQFPGSIQIRFSLGQQYVRTKQVEEGFELFKTCCFPEVPAEYALTQARYAYLWNRYDDGLFFIRPILEAYKQVKILDDHFLYMRGLPFFGRWWSAMAALSILSGDLTELENTTQFVVDNCHDYDFEKLQTKLQAYREDKPELFLPAIEQFLNEMPAGTFPEGYSRMSMAIINSRQTTTQDAAEKLLFEVKLGEQDFSWLEDMRTLALAEIAHRFGSVGIEQERVEQFLKSQPLLFEPENALDFHLLRYQELLKPRVGWY